MSSEVLSSDAKIKQEPSEGISNSQAETGPLSSPLSSPPSSPPVVKADASQEMQSATRKRSHEEMNAAPADVNDSSSTAIGDIDTASIQHKQGSSVTISSVTIKPSTAAHTMPPPPAPTSGMLPPSQKPPRSGQGPVNMQSSQLKTDKATDGSSTEQSKDPNPNDSIKDDGEVSDSSMLSDPRDRIEDFDWDDLQHRYHDKIDQLNATEGSIMNEFNNLCDVCMCDSRLSTLLTSVQYFSIWTQAGSNREVDRTFKRYAILRLRTCQW